MPSPVTPNDFKALIPALNGDLCGKFMMVFELPKLVWTWISWQHNEDGTFSDAMLEEICLAVCECEGQSGPVNPNMPAPSGVSATDGTYSDKINVTWNAVTPATGVAAVTEYKLYRSLSTNTDPNNATLVATVTAPTTTYDDPVDGDLIQGTTYNYWVVATNGTDTSNFSASDVGNAGAPSVTLPAISNLTVSKGFYGNGLVSLVWTKPTGATHFSIYRHTSNDFSSATQLEDELSPTSTDSAFSTAKLYDNVDELVYFDTPPSASTTYYYWVVSHKSAPPAISPESNTDTGWAGAVFPFNASTAELSTTGTSVVVPSGIARARIVLIGSGASGAGGGLQYGGGGGGGPAIAVGEFAVSPGDTISIVYTPNTDTGTTADQDTGNNGSVTEVELNGSVILTTTAPTAGQYSASGGGVGGSGGQAIADGSAVNPILLDGRDGKSAVSGIGGKSGYYFGQRRFPGAHYNGFPGYSGNNGGDGSTGSGSYSTSGDSGVISLATGGFGLRGRAEITFSAT